MSTLVMPLADSAPVTAAAPPSSPGLFRRLIQARDAHARRKVAAHLASQSDDRLAGLGFSADGIRDLREGKLPFPVAR